MLRVLLAIDGLGPGGAERQFHMLCEGLAGRVDVAVWALHGGHYAGSIEDLGVRLVTAPAGRHPIGVVRSAFSLAAGFAPSVIHSWGWVSASLMCLPARESGVAHVTGLVRMGTLPRRKRARLLLAARLGDLCTGNSASGLSAWRIPARKARLVRNGFDPRRVEGVHAAPGSHERFTCVMAGSMSNHKDFATLIDAAAILEREHPGRFRFDLLGDGPDRRRLEERARAGGGLPALCFHGRTGDSIPYLAGADAGILLSPLGEGMSNFLMECMAAGLPVVCTEGGGNTEMVRDSLDGWMVPQKNARALADRLRAMSADPGLCARMGESGRARILGEFSARRMLEATLAVYEEAVSGRAGHGI